VFPPTAPRLALPGLAGPSLPVDRRGSLALHAMGAAAAAGSPRARRLRARDHASLRPLRRAEAVIYPLALAAIVATSLLLFAYGANLLYLSWHAHRLPRPAEGPPPAGGEVPVLVQLPVYNERYVAE